MSLQAQPIILCIARQNSGHLDASICPHLRPRAERCRSIVLSRFATLPSRTPSADPTATSVARPRAVDVMGATTIECKRSVTRDRVNTTTGRILSFGTSAHQTSPLPMATGFACREERHDIVGNRVVVGVEGRCPRWPPGAQCGQIGIERVRAFAERSILGISLGPFHERGEGEIDKFGIRQARQLSCRSEQLMVDRRRNSRAHATQHSIANAMTHGVI